MRLGAEADAIDLPPAIDFLAFQGKDIFRLLRGGQGEHVMADSVLGILVGSHVVDHVPDEVAIDIQLFDFLARPVVGDKLAIAFVLALEVRQFLVDSGGAGGNQVLRFLLARQLAVGAMEARQDFLIIDVRAAHILGAGLIFGHARHNLIDGGILGQRGQNRKRKDDDRENAHIMSAHIVLRRPPSGGRKIMRTPLPQPFAPSSGHA